MPKALSLDLRKRVVEAHQAGKGTFRELAQLFAVGEATVNRWVSRFKKTGAFGPLPRGGGNPRKINAAGEKFLSERLKAKPDMTLRELVAELEKELGIVTSLDGVSQALRRMGYTRKKSPSTLRSATVNESKVYEQRSVRLSSGRMLTGWSSSTKQAPTSR